MTTGHIMMAMTLDGFVARRDHAIDWLMKQQTGDEDHGFDAFQDSIDIIVMGANSFKSVLGFGVDWPYKKPVLILSHSLSEADIPADLRGKAEICSLTPIALMRDLAQKGIARAYIDGAAVVQSFLREGLIADMHITLIPILIGDGIPLFGLIDKDIDLKLETVTQHPSGLVDMRYAVVG